MDIMLSTVPFKPIDITCFAPRFSTVRFSSIDPVKRNLILSVPYLFIPFYKRKDQFSKLDLKQDFKNAIGGQKR